MKLLLYVSILAAYLLAFVAIISRLNKGLDEARSINVRGIMTVAAVALLGWPVLLMRLTTTHVFASWHHAIPPLWLAAGIPVLVGVVFPLFTVIRRAGGTLPPRDFVWPLLGHLSISVAYYYCFSLEIDTGNRLAWIVLSGAHLLLGLTAVWLSIRKKFSKKIFIRTWHYFGITSILAGSWLIFSQIPRHLTSNRGIERLDTALADLPLVWLPALLLPLYLVLHLWGAVHIGRKNISNPV